MPKNKIPTDNWIGKTFANGWEIIRKISKKEELLMGMGTHNAHFECYNHNCEVTTCIEKTTLNTYLSKPEGTVLYNCRKCNPNLCKYKDKVRKQIGRDAVTADYSKQVKVGNVYGPFEVIKIISSTQFGEHQSRALVKCRFCGKEKECLFHHLTNINVACECFKNHSTGEKLIKEYLDNHNYNYITEQTFKDLKVINYLRYDFAIYLKDNNILCLIEFDGEQHYQEAGTHYNEDGKVQIYDKIKNNYAKEHNIPLLRIPYYDANKINDILDSWFEKLKNL